MYEYIPNPKKKKAKVLGTVLFFLSLVLFAMSGFKAFAYTGVLQTVSIAMMSAAILIMGRYLLKSYLYRIEENGDFVVEEISRTMCYAVCRLELSKLTDLRPWSKEAKPKKVKLYNYCVDLAPADSYRLTFLDGEETIYIRFSPDEKMLSLLQAALAENGGAVHER